MSQKKELTFIINPISGTRSKEDLPAIIESRLDKDLFNYKLVYTEYSGHAAEIASQCAAEHEDIVVAVGGDGTVNEVARSLVHTETALGIIPFGSGNGLARHLCLPMEVKKAISMINACKVELFDYGVINGQPFFCTCGMGFDAFISLKFAEAGTYRSTWSFLSLNPSKKIETDFSAVGSSRSGHLAMYCLSLFAQSLTHSFSSCLNFVIKELTLCLIPVFVKAPMKSISRASRS